MPRLSVGDEAPNFDLASTEDAVLMLRDEVPRSAVLLYFFEALDSEPVRRDLKTLAIEQGSMASLGSKIFAISPAKVAELKALQRELGLPYPLLCDDRSLSRSFGFDAGQEPGAEPLAVLVNRDQRVLWQGRGSAVDTFLEEIRSHLKSLPSSTANYPRSVINRLVDLWVN